WCGAEAVGHGFYEALGCSLREGGEFCPFATALAGGQAPVSARLVCRDNRHLELHVSVLADRSPLFLALCHDVTAEVQQQQKLAALHKAGRELAALAPEQLSSTPVEERVELLKGNIRRLTRDLLHYEFFEVRLLDPSTGRLEVLLQ